MNVSPFRIESVTYEPCPVCGKEAEFLHGRQVFIVLDDSTREVSRSEGNPSKMNNCKTCGPYIVAAV